MRARHICTSLFDSRHREATVLQGGIGYPGFHRMDSPVFGVYPVGSNGPAGRLVKPFV